MHVSIGTNLSLNGDTPLTPAHLLTCRVSIPIDGVTCSSDGRYRITLDGQSRVVAYHVDTNHWFLLESSNQAPYGRVMTVPVRRTSSGAWERGRGTAPPLAGAHHEICLPPLIEVPQHTRPVPRILHFIWIGDAPLPDALASRITQNAERCPGFQCRLYLDTHDRTARERMIGQFQTTPRMTLVDLQHDLRFQAFRRSPIGQFYRHFASSTGNNYSAASDILRAYLLHRDGGLYLDVDDVVSYPVPALRDLLAGPRDVLLNRMVTAEEYGFSGYPSSNFACHPGNPVLAAWLDEMTHRLMGASRFLQQPRPWKTKSQADHGALLEYISTIFRLVGPGAFNDALRASRPDYYYIERDLVSAYRIATVSPAEPRFVFDRYFDAMHVAKAFYLPFAEPEFDVAIGSAHSWNPTVATRGEHNAPLHQSTLSGVT